MIARGRFVVSVLVAAVWLVLGVVAVMLCQNVLAAFPAGPVSNAPDRPLQRVTLQLKWYHQFQFAGYYAAIEQGYFRDAGLDVVLKDAIPQMDPIAVVATGQAEYGISGSNLLIQRVQGQPIVVIGAIFQHSPTILMARRDSDIITPQDLRGKRVMIEAAVLPEITAMLRNEGLDDRRIQRLPATWNVDDLIERRTDAASCYVTNEPFLMQQRGIAVSLINPMTYGVDFYGDCLFTNEKEATEHPDRVMAFMEATRRGWLYAMTHRAEMADLIVARYNSRKSREHLLFEADAMETLIMPDLIEIGHMNPWRWRHIGDQYARLGLLKPNYSMEGFLFAPPQHWSERYLRPLIYMVSALIAAGLLAVSALVLFNGRLRHAVKKQTALLQESEQQLRRAVVGAPFPVMIRAEDGQVVMASNAWYEITGYRPEEIATTTDWTRKAYGERAEEVKARIDRIYSAASREDCGECEVTTAGGEKRVWHFSAAPLGKAPDGKRRVITMAVDVTARKRAEEATAEASRAKDRLMASVSHELRTPLTPVLLCLSAMQEDPRVPPALHESLAMMRRGVELESRLIDGLLDLTRMTRGTLPMKPEVVDAHELLGRALAMSTEDTDTRARARRPEIRQELKAQRHMVCVDPARMQQVYWNIILNAMQYTPDGGTLTISSHNTADGMLELRFVDTGIGIEPEFLPRIFDAFERGTHANERRPGGLGLGMSIAKSLMERLGGSITAASEGRGKGSTFTIRLPLAPASAPAAAQSAPPAAPVPEVAVRVLRILLVEDHLVTRKVLAQFLRTMGHTVQTASTVQEAIAAAQVQEFNLLLSDIGLPDGSGTDVMRWFGVHRPIMGIALSGFGQTEDRQRSIDAGFVMHLVKPVSVSTLREALQQVMELPNACCGKVSPRGVSEPQAGISLH